MKPTPEGKRLLMVSWKDHRHPRRGGAELYTLMMLEGLVNLGYQVVWLVPRALGQNSEEHTAGGVHILRRGRGVGQYLAIAQFLIERGRNFDWVIDQINTLPMSTLLWHPRVVVLIHQLAREVWFYELPRPLALLGHWLEPHLLRPYRHRPAIAVSKSTARDLMELGFEHTLVAENALTFPLPAPPARLKPEIPHFVGLGRLVRMKRFEHLLEAFSKFYLEYPEARLTLIGRGEDAYAQTLAARVRQTPGAELLQNASEAEKQVVLSSATAVVATSVREGWGLMVSEGHAYGTPSLVYRVAGLVDSTRHGEDGLLCEVHPEALTAAMLEIHQDSAEWQRMSECAYQNAARMTPERLAERWQEILLLLSRS